MSDKKPDFDSLDFSDFQKEKEEVAVAKDAQQESDLSEKQTVAPPKKEPKRNYNAWINGKPIEEVTSTEMVDWANNLVGVDLNPEELKTPKSKIKIIDKVLYMNKMLAGFDIGHTNKDHKKYTN